MTEGGLPWIVQQRPVVGRVVVCAGGAACVEQTTFMSAVSERGKGRQGLLATYCVTTTDSTGPYPVHVMGCGLCTCSVGSVRAIESKQIMWA